MRHTGLIEVPLGMTLRQVVDEIGGGTRRPFKAIQTGGPLGGCLPAEQLDTPITYETMRELGSIMGSGGLIVMDEEHLHRGYGALLHSTLPRSESCGNCTPCRNGTRILADTLERITHGEGEPEDLDILRRASHTMVKTSLCGLGQAAANPVPAACAISARSMKPTSRRNTARRRFARICLSTPSWRNAARAAGCAGAVCEANAIQGERAQAAYAGCLPVRQMQCLRAASARSARSSACRWGRRPARACQVEAA